SLRRTGHARAGRRPRPRLVPVASHAHATGTGTLNGVAARRFRRPRARFFLVALGVRSIIQACVALAAATVVFAQAGDSLGAPKPVVSMGQPPSWQPYAGGSAVIRSGTTGGV